MSFASALGAMRGTFGTMITQIASAYGLDVKHDLATIIPEQPDEKNSKHTGTVNFSPNKKISRHSRRLYGYVYLFIF